MLLTRAGVEVPEPTVEQMRTVTRELTVAPRTLQGAPPQRFAVFKRRGRGVVVPRFWARDAGWEPARDDRGLGERAPGLGEFGGALREELGQPAAATRVLEELRGRGGALMSLPTGYGKTTVALWIASQLGRKVLVLVDRQPLREQWAERVAQFLPGASVSFVQGKTVDTSGDVVVAMLQTLLARGHPPETFAACGLLIVDECHHIGAEKFSTVMFSLCLPYVLGLSATPDRADGLGRVVTWFLGDAVVKVKRTDQRDVVVRFVPYTCAAYARPAPQVTRNGESVVSHAKVINALADDPVRTALVSRIVVDLAREGREVLVVSDRRRQCTAIAEAARAEGVDAQTFFGGDKSKRAPESRVVVGTYGLLAEGVDVPRLNALVMATPRKTVEQTCGRILRGSGPGGGGGEGRLPPLIVDVVDAWGPCLSQRGARAKVYAASGFTMPGRRRAAEEAPPPPGAKKACLLGDDED